MRVLISRKAYSWRPIKLDNNSFNVLREGDIERFYLLLVNSLQTCSDPRDNRMR